MSFINMKTKHLGFLSYLITIFDYFMWQSSALIFILIFSCFCLFVIANRVWHKCCLNSLSLPLQFCPFHLEQGLSLYPGYPSQCRPYRCGSSPLKSLPKNSFLTLSYFFLFWLYIMSLYFYHLCFAQGLAHIFWVASISPKVFTTWWFRFCKVINVQIRETISSPKSFFLLIFLNKEWNWDTRTLFFDLFIFLL